MQRTNIYLDERQLDLLDRRAADEGLSRAEVIRNIIDRALAGADDDVATALAAIDFSFGTEQDYGHPDRGYSERDRGDRDEHLTRTWRVTP